MSAGHFFVGLGAGIAILAVPVLTLTPGSTIPQHLIDWIDGPPPQTAGVQLTADDAAANRPLHGYQAGEPTPEPPAPAPTIKPLLMPTAVPTPQPLVNAPPLNGVRWAGTAVIRSGGAPVPVRRAPAVDGSDDPLLPDGSPVLVSTGPPVQASSGQWRAVRGLNGIVGWVPNDQVAVDGEAPIYVGPTPVPRPTPMVQQYGQPTAEQTAQRGVIANTGGAGVVLRNSPNDADRTPGGLMDGAGVWVIASSGQDWVQVRADNGLGGWIPAQYVQAAG